MSETVENDAVEPELVSNIRDIQPVVLKYKKFSKGRKKKKYSKGTGDWQRMERDMSKINKKISRAIAEGAATYDRERNKSASKKKDGAVRDFGRNLAEAISATMDETTSVPRDVAEMLDNKSSRKLLKRQLKLASEPLKIIRG
ncbi:MAG: hypothetical protein KDE04_08815 [Anaerolineales bacterium]|nr:hypothetical protein [Anaerolineales bacterium]MCB0030146.1 hypothetical protein [Anaerolineales bacterium]